MGAEWSWTLIPYEGRRGTSSLNTIRVCRQGSHRNPDALWHDERTQVDPWDFANMNDFRDAPDGEFGAKYSYFIR